MRPVEADSAGSDRDCHDGGCDCCSPGWRTYRSGSGKEGDEVKRDQLVAVMTADELQAERAYHEHNVASIASQVGQKRSPAALRSAPDRGSDTAGGSKSPGRDCSAGRSCRRAGERQDNPGPTQRLAEQGVAPSQQLDQARTAYDAAKARVDTMAQQVESARAAVALARANSEQISASQSRVRSTEQQRQAAAAQRAQVDVRLLIPKSTHRWTASSMFGRPGKERSSFPARQLSRDQPRRSVGPRRCRRNIHRSHSAGRPVQNTPAVGRRAHGHGFYRAADAGFATQRDVSRIKRDIKTFEIRLRVDNKDRHLAVGMTIYVDLPL